MVSFVKKCVLYHGPQKGRLEQLRVTVPQWLDQMDSNEQLIIGVQQLVNNWEEVLPIVIGKFMEAEFYSWLENAAEIIGPEHAVFANAHMEFVLMVVDNTYDPLTTPVPTRGQEEMVGTLDCLQHFAKLFQRAT